MLILFYPNHFYYALFDSNYLSSLDSIVPNSNIGLRSLVYIKYTFIFPQFWDHLTYERVTEQLKIPIKKHLTLFLALSHRLWVRDFRIKLVLIHGSSVPRTGLIKNLFLLPYLLLYSFLEVQKVASKHPLAKWVLISHLQTYFWIVTFFFPFLNFLGHQPDYSWALPSCWDLTPALANPLLSFVWIQIEFITFFVHCS